MSAENKKNKPTNKIKEYSSSAFSKAKALSIGKKIYVSIWFCTGVFLFALVGLFLTKKDNYGGNVVDNPDNYSQYSEIIELVPQTVIDNNGLTKDQYYVQSTDYYDMNDDGVFSRADGDIVPGTFYPLSVVEKVPRNGKNIRFDFERFHKKGYGWPEVKVKGDPLTTPPVIIHINGAEQVYQAGDDIELKTIYDADEYNPTNLVADAQIDAYLSKFAINNINQKKTSQIAKGDPFYEVEGRQAYDAERESDGITPHFRASESALKTIDMLNAMGLTFFVLLTGAVFSTVIVTIYDKKRAGGKK